MQVLLPTTATQELEQTLILSVRTSAGERVLSHLHDRWQQNPDDGTVVFEYALSLLAKARVVDNDLEKYKQYEDVLRCLNKAVAVQPGLWMARFYRAWICLAYPREFKKEPQVEEDIEALFGLQHSRPQEPYFLVTYVLAALISLRRNRVGEAEAIWSAGLELVPAAPVSLFPSVFVQPFQQLVGEYQRLKQPAAAQEVRKAARALFPNQPV